MLLTKYTHACVRLERNGHVLVLDPGNFSEVDRALDGAGTVLITHEHEDHVDRERLPSAILAMPELQVYGPAGVAEELRALVPEAAARASMHRIPEPGSRCPASTSARLADSTP